MQVFKFGGASVKNAEAVRNVGQIIKTYATTGATVIVSAMDKTTNSLEKIVAAWKENNAEEFQLNLTNVIQQHRQIVSDLFPNGNIELAQELTLIFEQIRHKFDTPFSANFDFEYDQIVSLGEIISTKIIHAYLLSIQLDSQWKDARKLIRTNRVFRNGDIDWKTTEQLIQKEFDGTNKVLVTQGFIGHTPENLTTTLGREGSDYTAAIFAFCLNAENVTIWKDVPGMLNADPKYFQNTVKLDQISFKEAIELAYYGASVIHPKTIKPLQNKGIPLFVKSFIDPEKDGTVIQEKTEFDAKVPSYIFKQNQILISVMPTDFSFIAENSLQHIFQSLAEENVTINLMQNSAVSFSFLVDAEKIRLDELITRLSKDFKVKYNADLELVTIRHYNDDIISEIIGSKHRLLTQMDRQTVRMVLKN